MANKSATTTTLDRTMFKPLGRGLGYCVGSDGAVYFRASMDADVLASAPKSSTGKTKLPHNTSGWVSIAEIPDVKFMIQGSVVQEGAILPAHDASQYVGAAK